MIHEIDAILCEHLPAYKYYAYIHQIHVCYKKNNRISYPFCIIADHDNFAPASVVMWDGDSHEYYPSRAYIDLSDPDSLEDLICNIMLAYEYYLETQSVSTIILGVGDDWMGKT